jgi:hypothetical protein
MRIGVLLAVGVGVAGLMALWPLMVALSDAAVFGLAAVAASALGVLAFDAFAVIRRRWKDPSLAVQGRAVPPVSEVKLRSGCTHSHS